MRKLGKTFTTVTDNFRHGHEDDRQKVSSGRTKLLDFNYDWLFSFVLKVRFPLTDRHFIFSICIPICCISRQQIEMKKIWKWTVFHINKKRFQNLCQIWCWTYVCYILNVLPSAISDSKSSSKSATTNIGKIRVKQSRLIFSYIF